MTNSSTQLLVVQTEYSLTQCILLSPDHSPRLLAIHSDRYRHNARELNSRSKTFVRRVGERAILPATPRKARQGMILAVKRSITENGTTLDHVPCPKRTTGINQDLSGCKI